MLMTNTGTVSGQKVIYNKTEIQGESRGQKIYLYLDFVKDGAETPTLSVSVKETTIGDNYYTLLTPIDGVYTTITHTLSETGKYALDVTTAKSVEYVAVDLSLFTTSTLTIDFGLDNYFA